jgi:PKD repeat protein
MRRSSERVCPKKKEFLLRSQYRKPTLGRLPCDSSNAFWKQFGFPFLSVFLLPFFSASTSKANPFEPTSTYSVPLTTSPSPMTSIPSRDGLISTWQGQRLDGQTYNRLTRPESPSLSGFFKQVQRFQLGALPDFRFPQQWSLRLKLGEMDWALDLEVRNLMKENPSARSTNKTLATQPLPKWQTYRGKVRGAVSSEVRLTTDGVSLTGFVRLGNETHFIEPSRPFNPQASLQEILVYQGEDVVLPAGIRCGTVNEDLSIPASTEMEVLGKKAALPRQACGVVEMAIATHATMMAYYKTEDAVKKRIMEILNMVEGLYQDTTVNLKIRVTEIITEPADGHTWGDSLDTYIFLDNLMKWSTSTAGFKQPFDVASLWFYQPGSGIVGLARGGGGVSTGVVCRKGQNANVIREFSRSAYSMMLDQAHELAHNFGAPHISDPTLIMNPSITGKNDKWGDSTPQTISGYRARVTCLGTCDVPPSAQFIVAGRCGEARKFGDQSLGDPTAWNWSFGDGASSTERSPTHAYTKDGTYSVSLRVSNAFGSDTLTLDSAVKVKTLPPPSVQPVSLCQVGSANLTAQGSGVIKWWDATTQGQLLGVGPTYQTPVLSQAKTFYAENAESDAAPARIGPAGQTIGTGRYFSDNDQRRNFFDVFAPLTLLDVKVYASKAATRTIEVLNKGEVVVASKKVAIPAGESRVALQFDLDPGDAYAIKLTGDTATLGLYRNQTGAKFPYEIDGLISITGTDATGTGTEGYFYYFYDWQVQARSCASTRVPVQVDLQCVQVQPVVRNRVHQGPALRWKNGQLNLNIPWPADEIVNCRAINARGELLATASAKSGQGMLQTFLPKESLGNGLVWLTLSGRQGHQLQIQFLPSSLP